MEPISPRVVYTFGDSILDCGHYNAYGLTPGGLLVTNDDALFPEFRGGDLSRGEHHGRGVYTNALYARIVADGAGHDTFASVRQGRPWALG